MPGFFRPSQRDQQRMRRFMSINDAGIVGPIDDPFRASVVALLNMGGADGSTTFTDSTGLRTWTAHGNAQIDTSQGYNAAQFDGTGDYVTTPYVKADFDWWTGDYTLEAWIYISSLTGWNYVDGFNTPTLIGCADPSSTTNYWSFGVTPTGTLDFAYYNGSAQRLFPTGSVATGSLVHVGMVKNSSGLRFANNGTVSSTNAILGTPQSSTSGVALTIGQINNTCINGHIKALRITRADRGYATGYTPPPAPFPTS